MQIELTVNVNTYNAFESSFNEKSRIKTNTNRLHRLNRWIPSSCEFQFRLLLSLAMVSIVYVSFFSSQLVIDENEINVIHIGYLFIT